jgi:hypothetical protein
MTVVGAVLVGFCLLAFFGALNWAAIGAVLLVLFGYMVTDDEH